MKKHFPCYEVLMSSGARERKNDICEALVGDMSSPMSYRKEINLLDTDQEKKRRKKIAQ